MHPVPPHTTVGVNHWLETAVRWAADYRERPDDHAELAERVRAGFDELPKALKPLAMDRLEAFIAGASEAASVGSTPTGDLRANAALVREWLVA